MEQVVVGQTTEAEGAAGGVGESAWVRTLVPRLEEALRPVWTEEVKVRVRAGYKLPYAYEIVGYKGELPAETHSASYKTDLFVSDERTDGGGWTPRVIIECKIKGVTTHDALTYTAKAATHKHVHPYVRYGILIGSFRRSLPAYLVRHGAYFDFMGIWRAAEASPAEWASLTDVLTDEVRASRTLEAVLLRRGKDKKSYSFFHRPLRFK